MTTIDRQIMSAKHGGGYSCACRISMGMNVFFVGSFVNKAVHTRLCWSGSPKTTPPSLPIGCLGLRANGGR
jgi:hypothetical protein